MPEYNEPMTDPALQTSQQGGDAAAIKPKIRLLVVAVSVLALVIIGAALFVLLGGSPTLKSEQLHIETAAQLIQISNTSNAENRFLTSKGNVIDGATFGTIYAQSFSIDRSVCAIVTGDDPEVKADSIRTLYVITEQNVVKISDHVVNCIISHDGTCIAYVSSYTGIKGKLYLYDVPSNTTNEIATNVLAVKSYLCISPNGQSVGYVGDLKVVGSFKGILSASSFTGYVYTEGKTLKIGERCCPLAVSSGAEYIYYQKMDYKSYELYVKYGIRNKKLTNNASRLYLFFNQDLSEILYIAEDTNYWSYDSGKIKISDSSAYISSFGTKILSKNDTINNDLVWTYFLDSLHNTLVYSEDKISLLDTNNNTADIAEGHIVGYNGTMLLYTDESGNCYKIADIIQADESRLFFSNSRDICVSRDLSNIYYCNVNSELYHTTLSGDDEKIAEYVDAVDISPDDTLFYITNERQEGDLYSISGDTAPVKVAEHVTDLYRYGNGIFYTVETGQGYDVYIQLTNDTFTKILSSIKSIENSNVYGITYVK